MRIFEHDWAPRSIAASARFEQTLWKNGSLLAASIHIGLPLLFAITMFALRVAHITTTTTPVVERPMPNVVQARFVQRGQRMNPNDLPNRRVPVLPTAPLDPRSAPSLNDTPHTPLPRQQEQRQREAAEDINRVLARAQAFAEREAQRVQEGDPNGIEEGTETQGNEGDLYEGRLYSFFKRGWSVPLTIDESDAADLRAVAVVSIGADAHVTAFRLVRESDNPLFDQSIRDHLQRFVDASDAVPPPPDEVAERYLGHDIQVNFSGRRR